ncbi:MAG TPA: SAM-dependent methyltransferase [Ilumatobacteraceae bacterium]|nr:SAM-dependent methyltransferase [Ilumatobacteraceae bacterium]
MPSAADEIRAAIDAAGGAIRFDEFMRLALYGEHGFYSGVGRAGRRGDFITSPEVGPLFGAVIARFLDAEWTRLGRPDRFTFVDAGAGPGTLARSVVAAHPACADALRYIAVEMSAAQRELHPPEVDSVATMPDEVIAGVVFANELLDNLPFRIAVYDGDWREALVSTGADGSFVEVLGDRLPRGDGALPATAVHGARAPVQDAATAWVTSAVASLRDGCVVAIDYGSTTALLADRPYREWLRTYRRNERGEHYLRVPGTQDISADVAVDQLPVPRSRTVQAEWLRKWGIDALVDDGKRIWRERASAPDVAAVRMRSRIGEAEALLDADGLGAFLVLEWAAGSDGSSPAPN